MKTPPRLLIAAALVTGLIGAGCNDAGNETPEPEAVSTTAPDPEVINDQLDSNLKNAATAMESFAVSSATGSYEEADTTALEAEGYQPDPDVTISVAPEVDRYCIEATHSKGEVTRHYDSQAGTPVEGPC